MPLHLVGPSDPPPAKWFHCWFRLRKHTWVLRARNVFEDHVTERYHCDRCTWIKWKVFSTFA